MTGNNSEMTDQPQSTIRVVVVDALSLFRVSLGKFLASAGIEVARECATREEALEFLQNSSADVVLLDLELAGAGDLISAARQAGHQARFLLIAGTADAAKSAPAIKLGASGIFLKSETPDRLVQAIHLVAEGRAWIDDQVLQMLAGELIDRSGCPQAPRANGLDERERRVLSGILGGLSNRTIGDRIGLSESSVKNVVQRLFHKSGVKTRGQLVRMALEGGFGPAGFVPHAPVDLHDTRQSVD